MVEARKLECDCPPIRKPREAAKPQYKSARIQNPTFLESTLSQQILLCQGSVPGAHEGKQADLPVAKTPQRPCCLVPLSCFQYVPCRNGSKRVVGYQVVGVDWGSTTNVLPLFGVVYANTRYDVWYRPSNISEPWLTITGVDPLKSC